LRMWKAKKPYSESTANLIDIEVRLLIGEAYQRTKQLLEDKLDYVRQLAQMLLQKEVLKKEDLISVLGIRPFGIVDEVKEKVLKEEEEKKNNTTVLGTEDNNNEIKNQEKIN